VIISLYSINWLVFITEIECLLRGTVWVFIYNSTFCPHSVFVCFVWIWEQTAIISLYSINWLVFITERECVYCAVRTGYLNVIWVICFIWIWEQTVIISLYNINSLVFITERECVYCAVRTGYLNVMWVICFIWIWEQTAIISLYSINWLVFITEKESVYCAVRTVALYVVLVNDDLGCPRSSFGIAADYGLEDPGLNPSGDEISRPSRSALGPTQPPAKWVPGFSRG